VPLVWPVGRLYVVSMQFGRWGWGLAIVGCLLSACSDDAATASATDSSSGGGSDTGTSTGAATTTTTTGDETTSPTSGVSATGSAGSTSSDETSSTGAIDTTGSESTGPAPTCGDGAIDPDEACDDGPNNADDGPCTTQCQLAACGDGLVGPGEACDDANQIDDDDCTNKCALASCGDGIKQPAEACDDGNADDTDACLATCVAASCGDGFLQADIEACDDGNANDGDDCTGCQVAVCDDGVKNGGETDIDCGGDCPGCGVDLACGGHPDCGGGLLCNNNLCSFPLSCKALKAAIPEVPSGEVTIDLDADGPEAPLLVYCEQTAFGGGWTRMMSAKYPHLFNDGTWQNFNADAPASENYSILGKRDLFKVGASYTYRYDVGDAMTWKDGPILFKVAWKQDHDPFTATTNGADYTYIAGDKPTTCGGFNGLHNKYTGPSYATDVDQGDGGGCWWMQVVPREDWNQYGYPPGYLHGFLGGGNHDPKHETQWEVLYIR